MKKIFSLTLLLLLVISSVPTFAFNDVSKQDWSETYVSKATELKLVNGYSDGSFKPKNNVTVAEFIAMTINALETKGGFSISYNAGDIKGVSYSINGKSHSAGGSKPSSANTSNKWYYEKVAIAELMNLIQTDNYERPITRAEMALVIDNALELLDEKDSISFNTKIFNDQIDSNIKSSVLNLYEKGIVTGFSDKTFRQSNPVSRAEAAAMILKMIDPSYRK